MAIDRKGRVVGNLVFKPEPAEPPVGQVKLDLLAQPTLETDRIAVADQQHPDHQLRIDRRASRVAVERRKLGAQPTQIKNRVDPAKQMIAWDAVFKIELIE